jgi:hypothetical protein
MRVSLLRSANSMRSIRCGIAAASPKPPAHLNSILISGSLWSCKTTQLLFPPTKLFGFCSYYQVTRCLRDLSIREGTCFGRGKYVFWSERGTVVTGAPETKQKRSPQRSQSSQRKMVGRMNCAPPLRGLRALRGKPAFSQLLHAFRCYRRLPQSGQGLRHTG